MSFASTSVARRCLLAACVSLWALKGVAQVGEANAAMRAEYARAEQAFQAGDLTRSSQMYSKILEQDSAQPFAWFRLGLAHHQLKNFRAALQAYDNALHHAESAVGVADLDGLVAKTRFNRALLLLDEVAQDLQQIPSDALTDELESSRVAVHEYVRAALRSASSRQQLDPIEKKPSGGRARSYVYTAPEPVSAAKPDPR